MKKKGVSKKSSKDKDEEIEEEEEEHDEEDLEEDEDLDEDEEEEEDLEEEEEEEEDEEDDSEEEDEDLDEDEEEEDEDEDLGEEDEDLDEDEALDRRGGEEKRSILPIIVVLIIIMASIGAVFLYYATRESDDDPDDDDDIVIDVFDNLGKDTASADPLKASISEINPSEEWFEVYIIGSGTMEGWSFTSFDEGLTDIPTVTGLGGMDHILIHTGNGTDELDGSDGEATVFLGLSGDVLENDGDEIALFDADKNIIDFAAWGGGNGDTGREGWNSTTYPDAPPVGMSLSLQGSDEGMNSSWTIGPASPLGFSIIEVDLSPDDDFKAHIINGRSEPVILDDPSVGGKYFAINASSGVPAGSAVNQTVLDQVVEYIKFTYNLLKEKGFGEAKASGTNAEGDPLINVTVTAGKTYSGECSPDGDIEVDIGPNKVASKQTVEHEMTHNFQFAEAEDGSVHINPTKYNFIDEGQAEFWGRYSAMMNFNLTWIQVEEEINISRTWTIYEDYTMPWINIFTDWHDLNSSKTYPSAGQYYIGSYLFIKFLMDEYGISTLTKLHNSVKSGEAASNTSLGETVGIEAIEKATGKSFESLLRLFRLYMLENRYTQYQNDTKFKTILSSLVDNTHTYNGTAVTDTEFVEPYGSRINRYNLNGSMCRIDFDPKTNNSRWQITIVEVYPDGSRTYQNHTLIKGDSGTYIVWPSATHVFVIKTRVDETGADMEYFNITLDEGFFLVPNSPDPAIHISNTTGNETFFDWDMNYWMKNLYIRLQIDDNSSFDSPYFEVTNETLMNYSLPYNLPDGTWWWRIRWEYGDYFGPWMPSRNFTIWRNWEMPEIIWDPEPKWHKNETGNHIVILPNSTITIRNLEIPEEIPITMNDVIIQFRNDLMTWGGINSTVGNKFPIGEHFEFGINYIEWRIVAPPFQDFPWFKYDTFWYPELPEFRIIEPANNTRLNENTSLKIQVDGLPDGNFIVESEFVFTFTNATIKEMQHDFLLKLTMDPGVFEVDLNIKEMMEGWFSYNISLKDIYGRESKPKSVYLEVDRSLPMFNFITDPPGTAHFKRNPSLTVSFWDDSIDHVDWLLIPDTGPTFEYTTWESENFYGPWDFTWHTVGLNIPEGMVYQEITIYDDIGNHETFYWEFMMDWTPPNISFNLPSNGFTHYTEYFLQVGVDILPPDDWATIIQHTARFVIRDMGQGGLEVYNNTMFWNGIYWETSVDTMAYSAGSYRLEAYVWDYADNVGGAAIGGVFMIK